MFIVDVALLPTELVSKLLSISTTKGSGPSLESLVAS